MLCTTDSVALSKVKWPNTCSTPSIPFTCLSSGVHVIEKLKIHRIERGWAYFAYFDREIGVKTILAMRKMKNGGPYKPYAIIDQFAFEASVGELQKGTPL